MMRWIAPALVLLFGSASAAWAQTVPFGKNKIQYRSFEWQVLSGEHVDVYFYPEEERVGRLALAYAEESYAFLERKFQHHPFERIPLIVYSSDQHFEQTNIFPGFIPEGVLGFTEYLKRRVAMPFRGDYDQFRQTLRHELVHAFQLSKLAEARVRHPKQRGTSPQLIHWWTEGLAEFWSGEQTTEDDMFVRDLVVGGRLPTIREFGRMYSFFSYPLGAELHKYLAGRFGEEYIVRMYEDHRRYDSFEGALEGILGVDVDRLSREWEYALQQRFLPKLADRPPLDVATRPVIERGSTNYKPVIYRAGGDSVTQLLFLSPRSGYTNLYRTRLDRGEDDIETVLEGERSPEFESFHAFESSFDVNDDGVIVLVSKFLERDALLLWDLEDERIVGRYQWDDLVGLKSPAWHPSGRRVVFEGLSTAGFSDLYVLDFETQALTRLTSDHYQDEDPDWSPDGHTIVFASDRSPWGVEGFTNLVLLDMATRELQFLTLGRWQDQDPRWSADGTRILFSSDRDGFFDLYATDRHGSGHRLTALTGGAFDPDWLPDDRGVVFAGFQDGGFRIYRYDFPPQAFAGPVIALGPNGSAPHNGAVQPASSDGWEWQGVDTAPVRSVEPAPYSTLDKLSIDFAAADAIVAPGVGAAQGAQFLASDMLGNHILFAGVSALQVKDLSNLVDSFSGNLFYLNLSRRLNYGGGVFRFKGRFRDVALDIYEEETFGAYFVASYPFSKFKRVELHLSAERSNRVDTEDAFEDGVFGGTTRPDPRDLTREGVLTSNYVSYVKDNTLWLPTGPIDGERYNITAGLVSCFSCTSPSAVTGDPVKRSAAGENYVLIGDYRRYLRTSLYSAYALRAYVFFSDGAIPARGVLGGPNRLRGYPYFSLAGSRVWLLNQEWRFPILNRLSLGFPFGELRLPGVQGALFADLGSSWLESQERAEGAWGSYGVGFRTSFGAPLVLRMDVGRRFRLGGPPPVVFSGGERFNDTFIDFFFGFNY
jgi:hypothetical protein